VCIPLFETDLIQCIITGGIGVLGKLQQKDGSKNETKKNKNTRLKFGKKKKNIIR